MGYISIVIPLVEVNTAEEGIDNPEYILLWFQEESEESNRNW